MNEKELEQHKEAMIEFKKSEAYKSAYKEYQSMTQEQMEAHWMVLQEIFQKDPDMKEIWEKYEGLP